MAYNLLLPWIRACNLPWLPTAKSVFLKAKVRLISYEIVSMLSHGKIKLAEGWQAEKSAAEIGNFFCVLPMLPFFRLKYLNKRTLGILMTHTLVTKI